MPDFKNFIRFTDSFQMVLDQEEAEQASKKQQDFLHLLFPTTSRRYRAKPDDNMGTPNVLGVRIAATHSAKVTANNGFYLPDRMKDGAKSWLEPFPKPILLHHDKMDDPVGRVKNAKYVDVSEGFRKDEGWIKRADKIVGDRPSDRLIDAFIAGELSPQESVDVVRNVFLIQDFNFTKDVSYPGLGYIELAAAITDPDAIRKVLDERFLTGSIGARSDAAVCSVCKKDWVKGDMCEHQPGREYDGVLCVVIAGNLMYDEYSYVNRPADQQSKNLEIFAGGELQNSISLDNGQGSDNVPEIWFNFDDSITEFTGKPQKDIDTMSRKLFLRLLNDFQLPEGKTVEQVVDALLAKPTDLVKELSEKKPDLLEDEQKSELLKTVEQLFAEQASPEEKEEAKKTEREKILDALKQDLGETFEDLLEEDPENIDDSDILYAQQVADVIHNRVEDMTKEEREAFLDAKLSSKKRKSLPDSAFCGPNRSFPVNDCAHYTAALRLLNRYKGSGSKSSIRACVERKGKRLGCTNNKKKKDDIGDFVPEYFDTFSDEQVVQMFNGLGKTIAERGLGDEPAGVVITADSSTLETLQAENKKLADKLNTANADSETLQKELGDAYKDLETVKDQLVATQEQNRHIRASHITAYQIMSGTAIEDPVGHVKELMAKTDEELSSLESEVKDSVNIEQINKMLNNGLANNPQGGVVVEDPSLHYTEEDKTRETEDEKQSDSITQQPTKDMMDSIVQNYVMIRYTRGAQAAESYLDGLKKQGIIPKEMPSPKQTEQE